MGSTRSDSLIERLEARQLFAAVTIAPYIDPSQETGVPFGSTSQWAQPWRAYESTVPASVFLDGTSLNYNYGQGANPDLIMQQLATHGIHRIRIEVGWGMIDYTTGQLDNTSALAATLAACATWHIRPLILLNSNSQVPAPELTFAATTTAPAAAGSTTLTLSSTAGIVVGYTGVSDLDSNNIAAQAIVTAVSGNTVTLSQPLPTAINAGASLSMATLKYRPFSAPASADYGATLSGWLSYVQRVAAFARTQLGTTGASDGGFDLEVWNELTFGSQFLDIDNYYSPAVYGGDPAVIRAGILQATVSLASGDPRDFTGVQIGDGFANTLPWPASTTEPAGVNAIDKHVYPGPVTYGGSAAPTGALDAQGDSDTSGWEPDYTAYFPEMNDTALQTEFIGRDMSPLDDNVFGTMHGTGADGGDTPVWITETNLMPNFDDPGMDAGTDEYLKAKVALRDFCFYLNKGATYVDLYDATSGDLSFGELSDSFTQLAETPGATYPADDSAVTSPEMAAVGNVAKIFSQGLDSTLTAADTRSITLNSVTDASDATQFVGDGTAAHPSLYDADLFTFLPYQVNASTFTIPYYVMTRDVTQVQQPDATGEHQYDLPTEQFSLNLSGVHGNAATVTAYDPINNVYVPVTINGRGANSLSVTVPATDYPYILTIHDQGTAPAFTSQAAATWGSGAGGSFTVVTAASPVAALVEDGVLPAGISFIDNGDGTGALSGTTGAAGTYTFTITASNGVAANATQTFTLTVLPATATPRLTLVGGVGASIQPGQDISTLNGTDFGQVLIGSDDAVETFTITNTGSAPLELNGLSLGNADFSIVESPPPSLGANESGTLELQMQTGTAGTQTDAVSLDTNVPGEQSFVFSVGGVVTTAAAAAPVLNVTQGTGSAAAPVAQTVDFGSTVQAAAAGSSRSFTLTNTGDAELTIESVTVPVGFLLVAAPAGELAPGGSAVFTVATDTTVAGAFAGNVLIATDAGQASVAVEASVIPDVGTAAATTRPLMIRQLTTLRRSNKPMVGGTRGATLPVRVVLQSNGATGSAGWSGQVLVQLLAMPVTGSATTGDGAVSLAEETVRLKLGPFRSRTFNLRGVFPQLPADQTFQLVARITGDGLSGDDVAAADPSPLEVQAPNADAVPEASAVKTVAGMAGKALPISFLLGNTGNIPSAFMGTFTMTLTPADASARSAVFLTPLTQRLLIGVGQERRVVLRAPLPASLPAGEYLLTIDLSAAAVSVNDAAVDTVSLRVA